MDEMVFCFMLRWRIICVLAENMAPQQQQLSQWRDPLGMTSYKLTAPSEIALYSFKQADYPPGNESWLAGKSSSSMMFPLKIANF
jgi:hypothetical protein